VNANTNTSASTNTLSLSTSTPLRYLLISRFQNELVRSTYHHYHISLSLMFFFVRFFHVLFYTSMVHDIYFFSGVHVKWKWTQMRSDISRYIFGAWNHPFGFYSLFLVPGIGFWRWDSRIWFCTVVICLGHAELLLLV